MKYEIIKAAENIYWGKFDDQYDLNMLFCRYQEFYESPNENFRDKSFTLVDFMEWYSKDREGYFSYTVDWGGFNLPGKTIGDTIKAGISDLNKYDIEMSKIHQQIKERAWREDYSDEYYLIGSCGDELDPHEFGHAMYGITKEYKNDMDAITRALPGKVYEQLCEYLTKLGYTEKVFYDEIQAYLSTSDDFTIMNTKKATWKKVCEPFREIYRQYNKDVLLLAPYWKNNEDDAK